MSIIAGYSKAQIRKLNQEMWLLVDSRQPLLASETLKQPLQNGFTLEQAAAVWMQQHLQANLKHVRKHRQSGE